MDFLKRRTFLTITFVVIQFSCSSPNKDGEATISKDKILTFRDQLFGVTAVNADHVWVVGYFGKILHSRTSGKHWVEQDSGKQKTLLDVDFVDTQNGWVVGDGGTILHTSDGGSHWIPRKSGIERRLMSVDFVDQHHGVAVGVFGTILRTVDGGETWEDRSTGEDVVLNKVCFSGPFHGWIVGEFGAILETEDGGATWQRQVSGIEEPSLFGVSFMDDDHGWAVGQDGLVLFTLDGGTNWSQWKERFAKSLFDVAVNKEMGYIVGADGLVLEKKKEWEISDRVISFSWLRGIALAGKTGWMTGDNGTILGTSDRGDSWQFITVE